MLAFALLMASPGLAELPPAVQADRHLVKAERQIGEGDYKGAAATLGKILELQGEHEFEIPAPFWFKYAMVSLKAEDLDQAEQSVIRYIKAAGREGQHYLEALELLDQVEQALAEEEKRRKAAEAARRKVEAAHRVADERVRRKGEMEHGTAEEVARRWPPGKLFRDSLRSGGEGPQMAVLPAESFRMGCLSYDDDCRNDEKPVHEVRIARPFAVSVYEVTFEEYDRFTASTGRGRADDEGWGRGRRPVINVSWLDAQAYVRWLSSQTGAEYWLLSESEWEYAARAGSSTKYSWGDAIGRNRANCIDYGGSNPCGSQWDGEQTAPVGSFEPNGFGLHDMHGNVSEWVADCVNGNYQGAPADGSAWLQGNCERRISRGGSWGPPYGIIRSADRNHPVARLREDIVGFRVSRTLTP